MSAYNINAPLTLILALLTLLAISQPIDAQNNPQDYVDAHNAARRRVGVPDIKWDNSLANSARILTYARRRACNFVPFNITYGQNIGVGPGSYGGTEAVADWVSYGRYYNHGTNSCESGHERECRAYTQVVWKESVRLGCGRGVCSNGGWIVACIYDPRGNIAGRRPY